VQSLVTIGTPHRGTPFAWSGAVIVFFLDWFDIEPLEDVLESWAALSPSALAEFNVEHLDHPQVDYLSYVGRTAGCRTLWDWLWLLPLPEVDNDCIVPVSSAEWGTVLDGLESLNHFEQLGRDPCPFSLPVLPALPGLPAFPQLPEMCTIATHSRHLDLYEDLLEVLGDRGH
jgi:hypothetical protein